jgi:hypothetical protein
MLGQPDGPISPSRPMARDGWLRCRAASGGEAGRGLHRRSSVRGGEEVPLAALLAGRGGGAAAGRAAMGRRGGDATARGGEQVPPAAPLAGGEEVLVRAALPRESRTRRRGESRPWGRGGDAGCRRTGWKAVGRHHSGVEGSRWGGS